MLTLSMFGPLIHICNYNVQLEARLARLCVMKSEGVGNFTLKEASVCTAIILCPQANGLIARR